LGMEIEKLNIYKRLRDFNVPASVLDDIFANEQDLDVLIKGWYDLQESGLKDDEIASKISELIFKEIGFDPTHEPVEK
jgi:methionine salvage enolase-phosphatase E1